MITAFLPILASFRSLFRSRAALQTEIFALRHQLLVLQRQRAGRRVPLRASDRLLWAQLSRIWPGWRRALVLVQPETVAIDFAVAPMVTFRLLIVFVVLSLERRRVLQISVTAHPTAQWTAQQMVEAFPWETTVRFVIRDRDRIYGADFQRRVKALGLHEVPTAPRSSRQNGYAE
jgi:hypothetical protein